MNVRAIRAIIEVEADEPVIEYTGRLVKTFIYTLSKEIRIFRGLRGIIAPLHISPLFSLGKKDMELGTCITSQFVRNKEGELILVSVTLNGEYIIHIGGEKVLVDFIEKSLKNLNAVLAVKFNDTIVRFKVEKIEDVTKKISEKHINGDRISLYLKAPTLIFNVFRESRLPKFSPSALEILMVPFMYFHNQQTIDYNTLYRASRILGLFIETYYSITTMKPMIIPFKGKREVTLTGKITYILDTKKNEEKKEVEQILNIAELIGVGESRLNGFGTVVWKSKE